MIRTLSQLFPPDDISLTIDECTPLMLVVLVLTPAVAVSAVFALLALVFWPFVIASTLPPLFPTIWAFCVVTILAGGSIVVVDRVGRVGTDCTATEPEEHS